MSELFDRSQPHANGYRDVTPVDVEKTLGSVRLVDVREPDEFTGELGRVAGSELVPLATVEHAAKSWARDQEIVLICRSSGRSGRAATALAAMGFTRVMNMVGGMLAWNESKLRVER